MALGAQPKDVLQMVLKQGMLLAISGIVFGLLLSAATARVMQSLLFQVQATDLKTYLSLGLALTSRWQCWQRISRREERRKWIRRTHCTTNERSRGVANPELTRGCSFRG